MISVASGARVLIATKPVDFRKGMDGLAALVKEHLRADPFSGAIFRWPRIEDGTIRLTSAQLSALIEGLDWTRVQAATSGRRARRNRHATR